MKSPETEYPLAFGPRTRGAIIGFLLFLAASMALPFVGSVWWGPAAYLVSNWSFVEGQRSCALLRPVTPEEEEAAWQRAVRKLRLRRIFVDSTPGVDWLLARATRNVHPEYLELRWKTLSDRQHRPALRMAYLEFWLLLRAEYPTRYEGLSIHPFLAVEGVFP